MSTDPVAALQIQLEALQSDQFALNDKVRRMGEVVERVANGLDDLEEVLTEVSFTTSEHSEAMQAAMSHRQQHLDAQPDTSPDTQPAVDGELVGPGPEPHDPPPPPSPSGEGGGVSVPDLDALHTWVEVHIAPLTRKMTTTGEGGGVRWCRRWWEHHDAVERFIALFLAFEELSTAEESATWLSVYLRDHLDPHLATLTSPYGPFYACNPLRHSDTFTPLGHADLAPADTRADLPPPTTSTTTTAAGAVGVGGGAAAGRAAGAVEDRAQRPRHQGDTDGRAANRI